MVNSKLFAQKPVDDGGTPESTWREWGKKFSGTGSHRMLTIDHRRSPIPTTKYSVWAEPLFWQYFPASVFRSYLSPTAELRIPIHRP